MDRFVWGFILGILGSIKLLKLILVFDFGFREVWGLSFGFVYFNNVIISYNNKVF